MMSSGFHLFMYFNVVLSYEDIPLEIIILQDGKKKKRETEFKLINFLLTLEST